MKVEHQMKLNAEHFEKISKGIKDIELRLFDEKRRKINKGDVIQFTHSKTGEMVSKRVVELIEKDKFSDIFNKEISSTRAGFEESDDVDVLMSKYYSTQQISKYGVLGIVLENVDVYAKKIWEYMHLNQTLKPVDAIFILGSNDLRVADRASELYKQGLAKLIICSGGNGKNSQFDLTEAEVFSQRLIDLGVPREDILLEPNATNTGENIIYTRKLLKEKGIDIRSFILVQKPYMERRSYATFKKQWEGLEVIVTSPQLTYEEYINNDLAFKERFIETMAGDLQRIKEYPKFGFQIEQDIPEDVLSAWENLVKMGYKKYFIETN